MDLVKTKFLKEDNIGMQSKIQTINFVFDYSQYNRRVVRLVIQVDEIYIARIFGYGNRLSDYSCATRLSSALGGYCHAYFSYSGG